MIRFGDTTILDKHKSDGTSTVAPIVGGLEINCSEGTHDSSYGPNHQTVANHDCRVMGRTSPGASKKPRAS